MKFLKSLLPLLVLPNLATGQIPGGVPAYCSSFTMDVTGLEFQWLHPVGGSHRFISGGTIMWGVAFTSAGRSGMEATTDVNFPLTLTPNNEFKLGELKHINFPIYSGGGISSVKLMVTVLTTQGNFEFTYQMGVDETPNRNDLSQCPYPSNVPCSDRILVVNDPIPQTFATMDGKMFEIDLLGFRPTPTSPTTMEFVSEENGMNTAGLYGSLFLTDCPNGGGSMGDPHFETWTGNWYDFQGACDMHLVNAPHFDTDAPLIIDVRTTISEWFSYIEAAAIKLGDDVLEVSAYGLFTLNGVGFEALNGVEDFELPPMAGKYNITHHPVNKKLYKYTIELGEGEQINIHSFKEMLSITIQDARQERFVGAGGMMGSFHTGEVMSRDGKEILEEPEAMAREWQVRDNEEMLFQTAQHPQYPSPCSMPLEKPLVGRLGKSIERISAEKACAHWSDRTREFCIRDVLQTGDLDFAKHAM